MRNFMNLKSTFIIILALCSTPLLCMRRSSTIIAAKACLGSNTSMQRLAHTTVPTKRYCSQTYKKALSDKERLNQVELEIIDKKIEFDKLYEVSKNFYEKAATLLELQPFYYSFKDIKETPKNLNDALHLLQMKRIEQLKINLDAVLKEIEEDSK